MCKLEQLLENHRNIEETIRLLVKSTNMLLDHYDNNDDVNNSKNIILKQSTLIDNLLIHLNYSLINLESIDEFEKLICQK